METLDKAIGTLKTIDEFTDADLKRSNVKDDIIKEYEKWANRERVSKSTAEKEIRSYLKEELARIHALKRQYGSTQKWIKDIKTSLEKESLVLLIGDWHVGKLVKDEKGQVIYNTPIALELLNESYAKRVAEYLANNNCADRFDEVVILFLGDLVDNEIIYDTQLHKIDMPVAKQKMAALRSIIKFVDTLEQIFMNLTKKPINIRIEGVRGNHGRVQKGSLEVSSWDTLIYENLDLIFSVMEKKNIVVSYTWDDHKVINIKGHTGLLRHKAPPQAETAAGRNKFGGWYEMFNWKFLCFGHFHHWGFYTYNGRLIVRNGTFVGTDDLSVELGCRDERCQLMFGVSKDLVPSFMHRIMLN